MGGQRLRLRRVSGWTTTGVPVIIGVVSVVAFPVAIAACVGLLNLQMPQIAQRKG
ncbi:MAG: hypothetical protein ABIM74_01125 [candidate division WOR-3 bacterium]